MSGILKLIFASVAIFVGLGAIYFWTIDQRLIDVFRANGVLITMNTGICVAVAGIAILLPHWVFDRAPWIPRLIGISIILFAGLIGAQDLLQKDFGMDQLFVVVKATDQNPHPGRMAPTTVICFILCGLSLLFLSRKRGMWGNIGVQVLTLVILTISIIGLGAGQVRLELIYEWYKYARISVPAAFAFFLLAIAIWLAWYRMETRPGGSLAREDKRIEVTAVIIITMVAMSAGMFGFGLLAKQMERILEAGLKETYHNHLELVEHEIGGAIDGAKPVATRILLNRSLETLNQNPNDAVAREIVKQDAQSFINGDLIAAAIYSLNGELITQVGQLTEGALISVPVTGVNGAKDVKMIWKDGPILVSTMDIMSNSQKIGTAIVENMLPAIKNLLVSPDQLGETAETRLCSPIDDTHMQCMPSIRRSEITVGEPRSYQGSPLSMDLALRGQSGTRASTDYLGNQTIAVYGPVGKIGLGIGVKINTAEFYGPIREKLNFALVFFVLLSFVGVGVQRLQLMPLVARLVRSEERVKAIMANVGEGIITVNHAGIIESVNPALNRLFGYAPGELVGKNVAILMLGKPEEGVIWFLGENRSYISRPNGCELVARRRSGEEFTILLTVTEMKMVEGVFYVGTLRDISERKRLERLKNEFVSTVSHELRTPLTSIRGSLGLLVHGVAGELPAKAKNLLDIAHKNSERLIVLINDILDMEKIESGNLQFSLEWASLKPLLEESIQLNKPYGEKYGVDIVASGAFPETKIRVDTSRFLQVMSNLISNAAKFSNSGGQVEIIANENEGYLNVSVVDHGAGIPEEFQSRIFGKFAQADGSSTRRKDGTGLGLSIAKSIVESMGGRISFTSKEGSGTTFTIRLPGAGLVLSGGHGGKILICEDDEDIAAVLRHNVEHQGMNADIAYSAREARDLLREHEYVALMLDLVLPDADGLQFLHEIHSQEATAGLPVVIISVKANDERKSVNGSTAKVVDWLQKPVDQATLQAAIKKIHDIVKKPNV